MPNWDESVFESGTVTEEQSSTFDNVEQQNLVDQFNNILNSAYINNLQPVFHKAIDQHLGIQISGDFKTTDATNNGDISYITVARNPNMVAAHDGYGLAWRKQPEHVLQVANAIESMINATNTADYFEINALSDDIVERFINEFNETPMQAAEYHYANSLSMKTNNKYLKYNVFLVDNDILKEGVWISPEMIWDQTGGKNQFLQAAKVWIEPNVKFEYNIKIYDKLGIDAWIYPSGSSDPDPLSMENRSIWRGQTYPAYVAMARYWGEKDTDKVAYFGGLAGGHFGIAVEDTHNAEWHYDNLQIKSFIETFPMHLFKFKPSLLDFPDDGPLTVKYTGVGYDPILYEDSAVNDNEKSGHSFVRAWVWNFSKNDWEIVGSHKNLIRDSRENQTITKSFEPIEDYKDLDGFVKILAHPANSGPPPGNVYNTVTNKYEQATIFNPDTGQWEVIEDDFSNDSNHRLISYYVSISNLNLEGIHRGNALDVYVHDPESMQIGTATTTMDGEVIYTGIIPGIHPYIQEIIEIRQHISQTVLDPSTYSIMLSNQGEAFSDKSSYKISFVGENLSGSRIDIVYRYYTQGDAVKAYLLNDSNRFPGADILVKLMPPFFVELRRLEYSGGLSPTLMKDIIKTELNNATNRLDKSDIINFMYTLGGATYVTTDFDVVVTKYSAEFVPTELDIAETYEISEDEIGRFYTESSRLIGVIQV